MNWIIIIAGILAAFVTFGHLIFGINWYLRPMLESNLETVPKATMQCVFHYVTVFLIVSTLFLLYVGIDYEDVREPSLVVYFIGINYFIFAIVQIIYAFKNNLERPLIIMFQWVMFLPIGILCMIGV